MIHIPKSIYATTNNVLYVSFSTVESILPSISFSRYLLNPQNSSTAFDFSIQMTCSLSLVLNLNSISIFKKLYLTPILGQIYYYLYFTLLN